LEERSEKCMKKVIANCQLKSTVEFSKYKKEKKKKKEAFVKHRKDIIIQGTNSKEPI
jgi:hypothetical protein